MSNKRIGCENFGKFYTEGKVRNRREWRGVTDTLYDYSRWLHNWITMAKMVSKPRNIKAMFRYRWMANYLAVPMMVDRHTQGLRDEYLRICHLEQDLIIEDVAKLLDGLFRGDRRIGKDKKFSDKVVLVDENEMTAVMMGFPTLKGLSRETPSTYVSVLLNQHAAEHYIDVAQEYGLAGDVCPMPEAEAGVSIDDDAPVLGACAVQCNTTCDGSLLGNGVISKRLELEDGIPVFQLAAPLRHREDDVQDYAAQEIKNAIAFIEEHTGEKWDWKAYFECAERVNYATKCRLEWLEMNKTDYPQVFGSNLALYTETNYMAICGKVPAFREVDRKIHAARRARLPQAEEGRQRVPPPRHRLGRAVALLHGLPRLAAQLLGHRAADGYALHGLNARTRHGGHARKPRAGVLRHGLADREHDHAQPHPRRLQGPPRRALGVLRAVQRRHGHPLGAHELQGARRHARPV